MDEKPKSQWHTRIGEPICWVLPSLLAGIGHMYAAPKAGMTGVGPGIHIALMNDRTLATQRLWHLVNSLPCPFILYGCGLTLVLLLLRSMRVRTLWRTVAGISLAVPGFWYFLEASFLGGKIITF